MPLTHDTPERPFGSADPGDLFALRDEYRAQLRTAPTATARQCADDDLGLILDEIERRLPAFTHCHAVTDPEGTTWYLFGTEHNRVSKPAARTQILVDGEAIDPHFYRLSDRPIYYVPDGNGEHECASYPEAVETLRYVILNLCGEGY
jgi:hypothetical protein